METLIDVLRTRASEQAEQRAYTFLLDGEQQSVHFSYGELDAQARAIAALLQAIDAAGQRVLLLYAPGLDYIAAFFGCLYAAAIPVPVYPPDPLRLARTLPRLQAIVADAQATVALTTTPLLALAPMIFQQAPELAQLNWHATDSPPTGASAAERGLVAANWRPARVGGDALAFLQYTSGSTGSPKGVMLSHRNLLANLALIHANFGASSASVGVIWLPPYHDMGLIGGILEPLYGGFPVTLLSPVDFLKRPLRWLEAITRYGATISGGPNFAYDLCVRKSTPAQRAALDLRSWTVAFNGAEPIRPTTVIGFAAAFAPSGFHEAAWYPCYGLAEATLIATGATRGLPPALATVDAVALGQGQVVACAPADPQAHTLVGSGQPLAPTTLLIVDPATQTPCDSGVAGEIWLAGPSVALGYWQRPTETSHAFGARLAGTGAALGPWLRTGDLGFVQAGGLFVTGRLKDLIIIRGRNHYPQDIEWTVERSHPALRPGCCAAFAVEDGGVERLVVLQEVDRRAAGLDQAVAAIRAAVAAAHGLQIDSICLLESGSIPKTSSGKIQRYACRQAFLDGSLAVVERDTLLAAPPPAASDDTAAQLRALPADQRMAALLDWLRLQLAVATGRDPATLDSDVPVIALGLDSLAAVELQHQIEQRLAVVVTAVSLLEDLSVAQLAAQLCDALAVAPAPPRDGAPALAAHAGVLPLSFPQRRLWFMEQLVPGQSAYHIPVALRLTGPLDQAALQESLNTIVSRHEILRTTFHSAGQGPVQRVHAATALALPVSDLTGLPPAQQQSQLRQLIDEQARQPFDLAQGPLLRVLLVRLRADQHVLALTIHHIIADGWSMGVLLAELRVLYAALRVHQPVGLPALPRQYGDVALAQHAMLDQGVLRDQLAYWSRQLAGAPPVLELPSDYPRPARPALVGAHHRFTIDHETLAALAALREQASVTLYMVLLSTFLVQLHGLTGRVDLVVGTDVANRHWLQTGGLIGLFVNQLVWRVDLGQNPSFRTLLERVRTVTLQGYAQPDVPFDLLVETLRPARDPGRNPLFQVMFVLENAPLPPLELPDLELELLEIDSGGAPFDLSLLLTSSAGGLRGDLRYRADLFASDTIAQLAEQYQALLALVVRQPDATLAALQGLQAAAAPQTAPAARDTLRSIQQQKFAQRQRKTVTLDEPDGEGVLGHG